MPWNFAAKQNNALNFETKLEGAERLDEWVENHHTDGVRLETTRRISGSDRCQSEAVISARKLWANDRGNTQACQAVVVPAGQLAVASLSWDN